MIDTIRKSAFAKRVQPQNEMLRSRGIWEALPTTNSNVRTWVASASGGVILIDSTIHYDSSGLAYSENEIICLNADGSTA